MLRDAEKNVDLVAKHLSAAGLQEVGQFKVFAAALFSIAVLRRRYSRSDWFSFVTLVLGVILTQSQAAELVEPDGNVPGCLESLFHRHSTRALQGFP